MQLSHGGEAEAFSFGRQGPLSRVQGYVVIPTPNICDDVVVHGDWQVDSRRELD
jgi:hypothetical protein